MKGLLVPDSFMKWNLIYLETVWGFDYCIGLWVMYRKDLILYVFLVAFHVLSRQYTIIAGEKLNSYL